MSVLKRWDEDASTVCADRARVAHRVNPTSAKIISTTSSRQQEKSRIAAFAAIRDQIASLAVGY
jgi:hypothetical protein